MHLLSVQRNSPWRQPGQEIVDIVTTVYGIKVGPTTFVVRSEEKCFKNYMI